MRPGSRRGMGWWTALCIALCLLLAPAGGRLTRSATSQHSDPAVPVIKSFLAGGQYALLTFSGGPHFKNTPAILDILAKYGIRATFFVVGHKASVYPEIIQRMAREGHDIGHQGHYNRPLKHAGRLSELAASLNRTSEDIHKLTGKKVQFFRPPGGSDPDIGEVVHKATGLKTILPSIDVSDSLGKLPSAYASPTQIAQQILSKMAPGAVLVAHDGHPLWIDILPVLIKLLTEQGYELLTVSQMMLFPDDAPH